jgi:pimeloyl-ACP methyl ester carboxylesterase
MNARALFTRRRKRGSAMVHLTEPQPVRSLRMGRGEPLVLIHPFTTNATIWTSVAEHLADQFDVLMVTLPGHWGADKARWTEISIPGMTDFVEAAMDEVGWDTAHIAGNSLGGWLSLELGKRGRARTVTALAPAGGWGRVDLRRALPLGAKFISLAPLALVGHFAGPFIGRMPIAHRIMLSLVSGDWRKVEPQDSLNMMRASTHCSGYLAVLVNGLLHGGMRDMELVEAPVRLVLCEKDRIIPPAVYGSLFEEHLPDVHTIILEGIGHVPMLEAPEIVADVIADHANHHLLSVAI